MASLLLAGLAWVPTVSATGGTAAPAPEAVTLAAPVQPAAQPAAGTLAAPADTGAWGPVLDWGQQAKHMAMLSTGKVLVWSTGDNARVWNPTDGTFKLTPFTFGDLHCAGQSTLADGRVVVVGGQDGGTHNGTNITALFDPATETWVNGTPMTDLRWYATSTTLADGKVLATSGDAPDGTRSQIPELYDPATNTWVRLTGAQRDQGLYPFMFVLPNGLVYDAGPKTNTALLNPAGTGSWTPGPTALYSTNGYAESAVQYLPGKILRAGGGDPAIKTAMVVDMNVANPSWRAIDPMAFARRRMNLTILADGTVMALGGTGSGDSEAAAVLAGEIWDPVTEDWTTVEPMAEARMYHSSAIMLADGRVVIGGGEAGGRLRAQIYSPPYLFKGARPTISGSPASAAYGTTLAITSPDAASVTSVALLRPSAATHALDMNQKYVPLAFTRSGNTLNATGPASGGVAPPGDYMLIVRNAAGVPSVARWVRIGTSGGLQPGTVAGRVTDSVTDDPIQGATVASSAGTDTTDSQGRYSIGGVPAGELQLTFSFGGYATETRNAQVSGGQTTTLNVELAPPGGVAGRVTDASTGDPLVGATITYPGGVTITDTLGDYEINGVPAGSLALSFSALGYVSGTRTVTIPAGGVATQDVGLTPSATYVAGEVRDVATDALLVGATVSISTGQTTTTDALGRYHVDLPPGDYTVTASAVGYDPSSGPVLINGGSYATLDFALVATVQPTTPPPTTPPPTTPPPTTPPPTTPPPTTPPPTTPPPTDPPATLSFAPVADSHGKSNSATKNYGAEALIRLRQGTSPTDTFYNTYLRFTVSGIAGRTVTGAKLRLFSTDGGPNGGSLYKMGSTWTETGVTWANAPARVEPALKTMATVGNNVWVEFALPAGTVTADGTVAFTLVGGNSNSVYYTSREGTNKPELVVDVGGSPTTPPPTTPPPTTPPPTTAATRPRRHPPRRHPPRRHPPRRPRRPRPRRPRPRPPRPRPPRPRPPRPRRAGPGSRTSPSRPGC